MSQLRFRTRRALTDSRRFLQHYGGHFLLGLGVVGAAAHLANGVPFLEAIYQAIGGFVFASEPPERGGAYTIVEIYRIMAPIAVGSALVDFAARLLPDSNLVPSGVDNHVVVIGAGRLGYAIATAMTDAGIATAVVNLNESGRLLRVLHDQYAVYTIVGDARDPEVLQRAGISRARAVFAVTGDDEVNVGVAVLASGACPGHVYALVINTDLRDIVFNRASGILPIAVHETSAKNVAARLQSRVTSPDNTVFVIVGFGGFGRALTAAIEGWQSDSRLVVVDKDPCPLVSASTNERTVHITADLLAPDGLDGLKSAMSRVVNDDDHVICMLCTDNDVANLAVALELRYTLPGVKVEVLTRMFSWPSEFGAAQLLQEIQVVDVWKEVGDELVGRVVK